MKIFLSILTVILLLVPDTFASAQEIQGYRPAPRGNDAVPYRPLIIGPGSPGIVASPNCTGSAKCQDFRVHRPIGPSKLKPVPSYGASRERRCSARYQSYRASDNTYRTFGGLRQRCNL